MAEASVAPTESTTQVASWRRGDRRTIILFAIPALVMLAALVIYPVIQLVIMSMRDYHSSIVNWEFVGLKWYRFFFDDPRFMKALGRTLSFTSASVGLQLVLGMIIALIMNRDFAGIKIVRTLLLLPMVAMPVASAMMWSIMYLPTDAGVLNFFLKSLGLKPSLWLAFPGTALFPSLLMVNVWRGTPFAMLIILAGLRSLPQEPFEAAGMDGASALQSFWYLTLPMVKPAIITALMFRLIDTMKEWAMIWVLTQGGPVNSTETLYVYGYVRAFKYAKLGYGSAILVALMILVILVSAIAIRLQRSSD